MPINNKIKQKIDESEKPGSFKKLMLDILTAEDTFHRFKKEYERIVDEYIKEDETNGQNK